MGIHAIHHVTAVTAHIGANLEFYTRTLGLRLVKKSVNQDDVSAYHLFYADAAGSPGTDMTFFDWPAIGSAVPGPGTIALTSFRVPSGSLDWWQKRLSEAGTHPELGKDEAGRARLLFADPEGQRLELVDEAGMAGQAVPWGAEVPTKNALRGIVGVDLESAQPDSTRRVLSELLGYSPIDTEENLWESADDTGYGRLRLVPRTANHLGRLGAGGVHHVAFGVRDDEELRAMQKRIETFGLATSGYVDRFYFHSLYFREPGGVLFELATDGPGFASDESAETLGEKLALPPFLESRRKEIEAGLKPIGRATLG